LFEYSIEGDFSGIIDDVGDVVSFELCSDEDYEVEGCRRL